MNSAEETTFLRPNSSGAGAAASAGETTFLRPNPQGSEDPSPGREQRSAVPPAVTATVARLCARALRPEMRLGLVPA
jgi:hypothetical protein